MSRLLQVVIPFLMVGTLVLAEEKAPFTWKPPQTGRGAFTDDLGMLDREREEYANSIAMYAVNRIAEAKASAASLEDARRFIALSLHLAPRNKRALVANYQLSRGILPEVMETDYSSEVLARLLYTRAQVLRQQGGAEDQLLATMFVELAAELDPRNEDAVYASELQRLDHGRVDWKQFTDVKTLPHKSEGSGSGLP